MPSLDISTKIRANLRAAGGNPAIVTSSETWSYDHLAAEVAEIETRLSGHCSTPVFICQRRSPRAIATYIAAYLSGNYTVFLAPDAANEQRQRILASYPPGMIVDDALNITFSDVETMMPHIEAAEVAYSIFTSGSTGTPKGVMISRDNLRDFIADIATLYGIGAHDRVLAFADFGFDVAMYEIYVALSTGAALCLIDETEKQDPMSVQRFLLRSGVSVAEIPPAILPFLSPENLPSMRLLSVGGEQVNQEQVDRWVAHMQVFNGYGPAECTIAFTQHEFRTGDPANLIGTVQGDNKIILLDPDSNQAILGDGHGELCVAGSYVGMGYSATPFICHHHEGGQYYRTGDIVSIRDGKISIFGRTDDIVKRHGVRISLKEIDATVLDITAAKNVRTVFADGAIITFVTGRAPSDTTRLPQRIENVLGKKRAPNHICWVEKFPLTKNGKVDVRALLATFESQLETVAETEDGIAGKVLAVACEVLKKNVNPHDNLFNLGSQSIDILRILHRVEIEFDRQIPYFVFANAPSVDGLCKYLTENDVGEHEIADPAPEPERTFVTDYLRGLAASGKTAAAYFLDRIIARDGDRSFCDVCTILEYRGSDEALDGYLRVIEEAFAEWASKPFQFVGINMADPKSQADGVTRADLTRAFAKMVPDELAATDCHKFGAVLCGDKTFLLFMHTHTDVDGYSLGRFLEVLETKWRTATSGGKRAPASERAATAPFAEAPPQPNCVEVAAQVPKLLDTISAGLPQTDTRHPADMDTEPQVFEFAVGGAEFEQIKVQAARAHASVAALLLWKCKDWLCGLRGAAGTPFWVPVDGRSSMALRRMNCVASALPLILSDTGDVEDAHRALVGLKSFEAVPMELIVDGVGKIGPDDQVAVPNLFAFQNCGDFDLEESDLELGYFETLHSAPIFTYYRKILRGLSSSICFSSTRDRLHCRVEYTPSSGLNEAALSELKSRILTA